MAFGNGGEAAQVGYRFSETRLEQRVLVQFGKVRRVDPRQSTTLGVIGDDVPRTPAQRKGDSLEAAVHSIEETILRLAPGFAEGTFKILNKQVVVTQGVRHEIDLFVVASMPTGYESTFIFECKNWQSKVGKNEIIVFSENLTSVEGAVSARGGAKGGDGGFVETSGLDHFSIASAPDVSARRGRSGSWLIDPYDITIQNPLPADQFDSVMSSISTRTDSLGATQQTEQIKLQSLANKRDEAFQTVTNFLSKLYKSLDEILANSR